LKKLENLRKKRYFFLSGKGGVGKTTTSCLLGLIFARAGQKTLIVSLDPAHSLSIATEKLFPPPPKCYENVSILEIDVEKEMKKYLKKVKKEAEQIVSPVIVEEIKKQIDLAYYSPGAFELAMTDAIYNVIVRYSKSYDKIIFDTAPSGYTVRLMTVPTLLKSWLESLISLRRKALYLKSMVEQKNLEEDPLISVLKKRLTETKLLSEVFSGKETEFLIVANPGKLPVEIAKKTIDELEKAGIRINYVVLNKWKNNFKNPFPGKTPIFIKELPEEPIGVKNLEKLLKTL